MSSLCVLWVGEGRSAVGGALCNIEGKQHQCSSPTRCQPGGVSTLHPYLTTKNFSNVAKEPHWESLLLGKWIIYILYYQKNHCQRGRAEDSSVSGAVREDAITSSTEQMKSGLQYPKNVYYYVKHERMGKVITMDKKSATGTSTFINFSSHLWSPDKAKIQVLSFSLCFTIL